MCVLPLEVPTCKIADCWVSFPTCQKLIFLFGVRLILRQAPEIWGVFSLYDFYACCWGTLTYVVNKTWIKSLSSLGKKKNRSQSPVFKVQGMIHPHTHPPQQPSNSERGSPVLTYNLIPRTGMKHERQGLSPGPWVPSHNTPDLCLASNLCMSFPTSLSSNFLSSLYIK